MITIGVLAMPLARILALAIGPPLTVAFLCSYLFTGRSIVRVVWLISKGAQLALPLAWTIGARGRRPRVEPVRGEWLRPAALIGVGMLLAVVPGYLLWFRAPLLAGGAVEALHVKLAGYGIDTLPKQAVFAVYLVTVHSLGEEYYWRWFVYGLLRERFAPATAIPVSALAFAVHHVFLAWLYAGRAWEFTAAFIAMVVLGGWVWAWLYERSGQLYAPWLSHAIVEIALVAIGYDVLRY